MGQFTAQPPDGAAQRIELLDDHALVALVRSGDERGLGELYRRHAPTALRVARSLTRAGYEADDVVADVFGGIWQAIRNGKGPTIRFEAYLVAAIRNRARSLPSQAIGQPIDDHIAALATMDTGPETGNNVARQAFTRLPTREQQMLWLTAVEGSTVAEAATALSLTRRAATTLKYRQTSVRRGLPCRVRSCRVGRERVSRAVPETGALRPRNSSVRAATDHDNSGPTDHPICASCARRDRDGVRHERFGRRAPAG